MRNKILDFLRVHPVILNIFWKIAHVFFLVVGLFVPIREKTVLITSFAGRKFDDSPKAIYEEMLRRHEFDDWDIIWAFVEPGRFDIPKGRKIRIDTWPFFMALLYSRLWVSNSGMNRNIEIHRKGTIKVETWHGTPIKKIGEDQHSGVLGNYRKHGPVDTETIRCAQSTFDRRIFAKVFHADKRSFLMSDLPRNDGLLKYKKSDIANIKKRLRIDAKKQVLLYMPTYREYLVNEKRQTYIAPPMDIEKWEKELGERFVLLFRAHYAVNAALGIQNSQFIKNVSNYPFVNDLYAVSDILISDYSSAYIDFAILDKPMLCFAYDEQEYAAKRGLYLDIHKELPCAIDQNEDSLIKRIQGLDEAKARAAVKRFHEKYAPYAGNASKAVVDEMVKRLAANAAKGIKREVSH